MSDARGAWTRRPCLLGEGWQAARPSGLNRYFASLIGALQGAGIDPRSVVVGPASSPPPGVTVVGDADQPIITRLRRFAAAATVCSHDADLVDTHFALYGLLPIIGPARRKPQVVHFHGPWADEGIIAGVNHQRAASVKRRIERIVYRRADAVVTLSGAFRQLVVERYRVAPWRVSVIPPAVDLDRFTPGDRKLARSRWSLSPELTVVGCVRRLTPRMGIDDLLRAWSCLRTGAASDRLLLIGGDGPARGELIELADELGVSRTVRFLGQLSEEELVDLYRAADLCVVPSVALEGFGLVVLEALACGTPVITTDAGGLPETMAGLTTDAVLPAGDVGSLAARLDGALSGRAPLPTTPACIDHARAFSPNALASAHEALYERVASRSQDARVRVVFLDHCAALSGAEIALLRLLTGMPDIAAHVVLAEDGPLVGRLRRAGVSVEVLPLDAAARDLGRENVRPGSLPLSSALHSAAYVFRLAWRLRSLGPDIVHCNSLKACLYGTVAARAAGQPVVWHARDRMAADYLPDVTARMVRSVNRALPTATITESHATLATYGGARGSRERVIIPNPFERTRPIQPAPDGPLMVGIVGRLAPWKGQHVVLDAFARAFPVGPQRCVIIGAALFGEDAYASDLAGQAERLGIADRVDFRGFQDDVEAEIDRLHVLVHASVVPEPFGQVIVEGLAAGRVVVASAAGGPRETITPDKDGLLYPPGDDVALADLLVRLDGDPDLCERLSRAALDRAADFTPALIGSAVMDLYQRILDGRRR